jgi:hypothetical protein
LAGVVSGKRMCDEGSTVELVAGESPLRVVEALKKSARNSSLLSSSLGSGTAKDFAIAKSQLFIPGSMKAPKLAFPNVPNGGVWKQAPLKSAFRFLPPGTVLGSHTWLGMP